MNYFYIYIIYTYIYIYIYLYICNLCHLHYTHNNVYICVAMFTYLLCPCWLQELLLSGNEIGPSGCLALENQRMEYRFLTIYSTIYSTCVKRQTNFFFLKTLLQISMDTAPNMASLMTYSCWFSPSHRWWFQVRKRLPKARFVDLVPKLSTWNSKINQQSIRVKVWAKQIWSKKWLIKLC